MYGKLLRSLQNHKPLFLQVYTAESWHLFFFRPRFTFCSGNKHRNMISNWDAVDSAGCMSPESDIWPSLSRYYGPNPNITQEKTMEKYRRIVRKYLIVFDSWSYILRKKY